MRKVGRWIGIFTAVLLTGCTNTTPPQIPANATQADTARINMIRYNQLCQSLEQDEIDAFLAQDSIGWQLTDDGCWYRITQAGNGDNLHKGTTVRYTYRIELLDGQVCYSADVDGVQQAVVGKRQVIRGLDMTFPLLQAGCEAELIIPSHLAYGVRGDGNRIPSRKPLLYRIKILASK